VAKLLLDPRVSAADANWLGAAVAVELDVAAAAVVEHVDLLHTGAASKETLNLVPEQIDEIANQANQQRHGDPVERV
jgi:hypothetical protein